jgi:hypothetical protein
MSQVLIGINRKRESKAAYPTLIDIAPANNSIAEQKVLKSHPTRNRE